MPFLQMPRPARFVTTVSCVSVRGKMAFSGDAPATLNARQHSRTKTANRIWKQNPDQKVPCPGSKPPALHAVKKLLSGLKAFSVPGASLRKVRISGEILLG